LDENRAVLQAVPPFAASLRARLEGTMTALTARPVEPFDAVSAAARLTELMTGTIA
jgi:hypothetical protein